MDKIEAENGGNGTQTLHRRADFRTTEWEMPQVFTPPGGNPRVAPNRGRYSAHESLGKGQIIYVLEDGIYEDLPNAVRIGLTLSVTHTAGLESLIG